MTSPLRDLPRTAVLGLADALERGRLQPPFHPVALGNCVPELIRPAIVGELQRLADSGIQPLALAVVLRLLAEEREATQRETDRVELVWSGPERPAAHSRDTAVVVRELLASVERHVLVAGFAVFQAKTIFEPLATRMDKDPNLSARMFLNVARPYLDKTSEAELLRQFVETFRQDHWSGRRLPEIFYDPRALALGSGTRACLHAKCIAVDDVRALVTSANFTEAAQNRNIETGVLVEDENFARSLRGQFEALVDAGMLLRLPGSGSEGGS